MLQDFGVLNGHHIESGQHADLLSKKADRQRPQQGWQHAIGMYPRVEKPKQVKHPIQDRAQHIARQSLSTNNIMTGSPSTFNPVSARGEQRRAVIALD